MSDDKAWEEKARPLFEEARRELEAEAPSPAALARAKAGFRERLELQRRPSLAPKLALAGAFALAAVAVVMWKRMEEPRGPRIVVAEGTVGGFKTGEEIDAASVLTAEQSVSLALGDAARVQLEAGTRARVTLSGVQLVAGRTRVRVARGPFTVTAGDVTLEVVGTAFEVAADGDVVRFSVSEGVVRATRGAERWEVRAGESWPPAAAPAPVEAEAHAQQLTRLEQAQELTRAGKLDAARAVYGELAKLDAPIAELALYHLAHLEAQRARRPKVALEALDEQLRRFPNGPLSHEAKLSRIEALRALGIDAGR